jgi:predicted nucleotidyltransferase
MDLASAQRHLQDSLPGLIALYLFGSQATGHSDDRSDVDFAVLVQGTVAPLRLWELSGELADIVHLPVDLVDLRAASTVMQYQIIDTGRRIWSCGLDADLYEVFILREKTSLDEARAGLLDDIGRDGLIYG